MISLEKEKILTPLQKLPNNVGNLGKLIVATGFEKLPKVQKIAQSGYTAQDELWPFQIPLRRPSTSREAIIGETDSTEEHQVHLIWWLTVQFLLRAGALV